MIEQAGKLQASNIRMPNAGERAAADAPPESGSVSNRFSQAEQAISAKHRLTGSGKFSP